ncbi:MAG TPA: phospholipase D-like domain-containing protein [Bryobacteraceae bacterium]|nr:phospholipase D-like domain-containing protein [Bryobacteraceae bacterium]
MRYAFALVFFCHLTVFAADAPPTHTLVTEPDQGLAPIYNLLRSATRTIDMTMYELADPIAEQILAQAAARHVAIRVILDRNLELHHNQPAFEYLQQNGIQVVWAAKKYAATHQKSVVVDGRVVAIMTLNLTSRYYPTTRDFAVLDTNSADIAAIEQVFDADFNDGAAVTPTGVDLVWSPKQSNASLLDLIRSAHTSLEIEAEEMSDSEIVTALAAAARTGVQVKVTMTYNKTYAKNFTRLAEAGVQVNLYSPDAALYIHAKAILADYDTPGAIAFLGSENFTDASLERNRELGLMLADPAILTSIHQVLAQDFAGGTAW